MNNAVVVVQPQGNVKNIGDYVQPVAILQFCDSTPEFIDREQLSVYQSKNEERTNVIVNGTYLWKSDNWPPSKDINPLFVSMHIFPMAEQKLFSDNNIKYWKEHEPIGCRDISTLRMFQKRNIDAYFSACATLTLGEKYAYNGLRKGIIFVDPYIPLPLFEDGASFKKIVFSEIFPTLSFFFANRKIVNRLSSIEYFSQYGPKWGHSHYKGIKRLIMRHYHALQFYRLYSQKFSDEFLLDAEYVTHMYRLNSKSKETDKDLCHIAEQLIIKYSKAQIVVTSRIHAALPCLGLNTPVIFSLSSNMESKNIQFNTPGRFEGIIDFFRVLRIGNHSISTDDEVLKSHRVITTKTIIKNKNCHEKYMFMLKEKIKSFLQGGGKVSRLYSADQMAA